MEGRLRALLTLFVVAVLLIVLYMSVLEAPVDMLHWKTLQTHTSNNSSCDCKCPAKEIQVNRRRNGNATTTKTALKIPSTEKPKIEKKRNKAKKLSKKQRLRLAEKEKYQTDQKEVLQVPTEAPGWIYNKTAANLFRKEIQDSRFDNYDFVVTKTNSPLNTVLQCYDGETNVTVSEGVLRRFPKESPFKHQHYRTCSVVGNGGVLKGSGCGEQIDQSEFVFRCNMAPLKAGYLNDVGSKTSLITINPSIIRHRYKTLRTLEMRRKFVEDLTVYGDAYVWIPAFASKVCAMRAFKAHQTLQKRKDRREVIFPHPDFIRSVQSFWQGRGVKADRASTGLFLASVATQLCEEVHLYGFWPYHSDRNHTRLTQHYYDNMFATKVHSLPDEFGLLQSLHNTGVLRLTTGACRL